jgi:hypothetical protein
MGFSNCFAVVKGLLLLRVLGYVLGFMKDTRSGLAAILVYLLDSLPNRRSWAADYDWLLVARSRLRRLHYLVAHSEWKIMYLITGLKGLGRDYLLG